MALHCTALNCTALHTVPYFESFAYLNPHLGGRCGEVKLTKKQCLVNVWSISLGGLQRYGPKRRLHKIGRVSDLRRNSLRICSATQSTSLAYFRPYSTVVKVLMISDRLRVNYKGVGRATNPICGSQIRFAAITKTLNVLSKRPEFRKNN